MGNVSKLPVNGFKWKKNISKFDEDFIKNIMWIIIKAILELDVKYPKNFLNLQGDLPFLAERNKIKKCKKLVCNDCMFLSCHVRLLSCHSMLSLVCNINDKENFLVYITALKQALNHGLILKRYIE